MPLGTECHDEADGAVRRLALGGTDEADGRTKPDEVDGQAERHVEEELPPSLGAAHALPFSHPSSTALGMITAFTSAGVHPAIAVDGSGSNDGEPHDCGAPSAALDAVLPSTAMQAGTPRRQARARVA